MKNNWYALTHLGAEPALARELSLHEIQAEQKVGGCLFTADNKTAARLLYHLQTATRLLLAIDEGEFAALNPGKAEAHIPENNTFKVTVDVLPGGSDLSGHELAATIGSYISRNVNLDTPDITIHCQVGTTCLLGIDIAGDLSKRYYRIFSNAHSNKGTLAAAILFLFARRGGMLDPFGNTGEIAIEAALHATHTSPLKYRKHQKIALLDEHRAEWEDNPHTPDFPVYCFDTRLGNLRSCKKNAKLAGVEKAITFSKLEPEWMDIKFEESEIDAIITIPPAVTLRSPTDTHIKELCYQAAYILKKKGSLILAATTSDTVDAIMKHTKSYKLTLKEEAVIYSGKLPIHVMRYEL